MQEIKAFNEKRAEIYWWLSSLYAKELTEENLEQYHSAQIRSFLTGLGENSDLKPSIDRVIDALNRLIDREDAQLELAADFCDLFLKSDRDSALPYASMYIGETGLLNDKPAKEMEALMLEHGVAVDEGLNEPADHIAIELDFLGNLIIRSNELEQERHIEEALIEQESFIRQHLLSWTPKFTAKCQTLDEFGFYSAIASLTVAFLELDCTYLIGE
ncbi:molecular chaperone TorD [Vibrio europaeus]|uniref:molecular chaperone TorD n=1 Tax=Vibrio europaeus TaxID=300876 RepID=UPI00233F257D|nr:molecular chaperone TorD [Vibrio europaeus]MDC5803514.1 molecular chaperone TorD [Vibrio europaeus]MDC5823386.1 molecular chaperone TorD [Vibrio europaeus]MDC5828776.1 molecular chaperone TorD [Vibrio europaeus]MDC5833119.1 molecular chaperone TorD [Vibrio europaeus]